MEGSPVSSASTVVHAPISNGLGPSVRLVRNRKRLWLWLRATITVCVVAESALRACVVSDIAFQISHFMTNTVAKINMFSLIWLDGPIYHSHVFDVMAVGQMISAKRSASSCLLSDRRGVVGHEFLRTISGRLAAG